MEKSTTSEDGRGALRSVQGGWARRWGGGFWPAWPAFYTFLFEVCGLRLEDAKHDLALAYAEACESACWFWPHADFVMACERPVHVDRDAQGRLHSETRPAIAWPDGWGMYSWHGLKVPADVILEPEKISTARIDKERNAELRRVLLVRFGLSRYVQEVGAKEISRDEYGVLWRRDVAGDDPILLVEVDNSTPEPDGSIKKYVIPVDPECRPMFLDGRTGEPQLLTARNAIASTFGMRGEEYAPVRQT